VRQVQGATHKAFGVGLAIAVSWSVSGVAAEFPSVTGSIADCEDQWFLVRGKDPTTRVLGFAYVDPQVGVTFEHRGEVEVTDAGELIRKPFEMEGKARLIQRVESNFDVTCLSEAQVVALGLPAIPEFQNAYHDSREPGPHYESWASHYNHIGASAKALEYVEAAKNIGYQSRNLTYEHAFALNAQERYSEALEILDAAVKKFPKDVNLRAERGFTHIQQGSFEKAIRDYEFAFDQDKEGKAGRKSEFANNIAIAYGQLGDEARAREWNAEAQKRRPERSGRQD
jgi:tetratricopeptide (TPR) repeat protein